MLRRRVAPCAGTKVGAFTFKLGNLGDVRPERLRRRRQPGRHGRRPRPPAASVSAPTTPAPPPLTHWRTPVTITVGKDNTKTADKAAYNAKKNIATGTAKVKSHFGTGRPPAR